MSNPEENAADNEHKEIIEDIAEEESAAETADSAEDLSIEEQLEKALEDVSKFRDVALRAEAEVQNIRRRAERDVEHAYKFGVEKLIQNLLPVVDGIEKAVEDALFGSGLIAEPLRQAQMKIEHLKNK